MQEMSTEDFAARMAEGLRAIPGNCFAGCTALNSIVIPDTVTKIGDGAFTECAKLKKVNLPDGLTEIEDRAFMGCKTLQKVDLPDGVTKIGDGAFYDCHKKLTVTVKEDSQAETACINAGCWYSYRKK